MYFPTCQTLSQVEDTARQENGRCDKTQFTCFCHALPLLSLQRSLKGREQRCKKTPAFHLGHLDCVCAMHHKEEGSGEAFVNGQLRILPRVGFTIKSAKGPLGNLEQKAI